MLPVSAILPSVGDPTLLGWGVFFAYFLAAFWCHLAAGRCVRRRIQLASVWRCLSLLLLLLGINKQLDFQLWLTAIGRTIASQQGWYENRFSVQLAFAGLVLAVVIVVCVYLLRLGWENLGEIRFALFGVALLAIFVSMRTISFDVVNWSVNVAGVKLHEMVEAVGVLTVAVTARNFGRL